MAFLTSRGMEAGEQTKNQLSLCDRVYGQGLADLADRAAGAKLRAPA